jgi:hypothetical protein
VEFGEVAVSGWEVQFGQERFEQSGRVGRVILVAEVFRVDPPEGCECSDEVQASGERDGSLVGGVTFENDPAVGLLGGTAKSDGGSSQGAVRKSVVRQVFGRLGG